VATLPLTLQATLSQDRPNIRCLVSHSNFDVSIPVWTDYTSRIRSWSCSVGRADTRSDFDAGTAEVTLDNNDRVLDPNAVATVRPLNRLQLLVEYAGETHVIFMGYVESWAQQWDETGILDATVTARCADELKIINGVKRMPYFEPPTATTYADVVQFDNPGWYWRWQEFTPMTTVSESETIYEPLFYNGAQLFGYYDEIKRDRTVSVTIPGWAVPSTGGGFSVANDTGVTGAYIGSVEDGAGGSLFLQASSSAMYATDDAAGDMAGAATGSIELWFKRSGAPGGNTMFWGSAQTTAAGTPRLWMWRLLTTGAVDFTWVDTAGTSRAATSGVLALDTWYHLLAVKVSGAGVTLYVNGVNTSSTVGTNNWNPTTDPSHPMLFQSCGAQVYLAEMAVYSRDLTSRVASHYTAGTARGFPIQKAHERLIGAFDSVGSQAPRSFRAGTRDMEAEFMAGRRPGEVVPNCAAVEGPDGALFASPAGTLTFLDAGHRSVSPWNTAQITFDDDGTDSQYLSIEGFDETDATIVNIWNVTKDSRGAVTQTASDSTSISVYGDHPEAITGIPLRANSDAASISTALLAKTKDPISRVAGIEPNMLHAATATAVFRLNLLDKITVTRRPPGGGSAITQDAWIQQIEHSGSNDRPGIVSTKLAVSPI